MESGNGHHIEALNDGWIPRLASGRSSLCGSHDMLLVKDLISPNRTWNEEVVRSKFPSFEAELVLDILLSQHASDDIRYWKWEENGQYSVKSCYLLTMGSYNTPESGVAVCLLYGFMVEVYMESTNPTKGSDIFLASS